MKSFPVASSDKTYFGIPCSQGEEQERRPGNYTVQLSDAFKDFEFRIEHPRPGISLSLFNHVPAEDIVTPYEVNAKGITFTVHLSGHSRHEPEQGRHARMIEVTGPCDWILLFDDCAGEVRIRGGMPQQYVAFILQVELLEELIRGSGQFDMSIVKSLEKQHGAHLLDKRPPSPQTSFLANQIFTCRLTGPCRDLYMEGKALEMVALFLHRMSQKERPSAISLTRSDVERIHAARDILLKDLAEPPSIRNLSKLTGLNEFKLKKGFREVFGRTVHETLRDQRLQTAHALLHDSDMTVGTVAAAVGYTNMGHFIALFREHYGLTPGRLLRHTRRTACSNPDFFPFRAKKLLFCMSLTRQNCSLSRNENHFQKHFISQGINNGQTQSPVSSHNARSRLRTGRGCA